MSQPISKWAHRNEQFQKAYEEEQEALQSLTEARERYLAAYRRRNLILRNVIKSEAERDA